MVAITVLSEFMCSPPWLICSLFRLPVQGHNPHHQLETIVSVLGLPPEEELSFVTHPAARKAIMSRANTKPKDLESYFPADASPLAPVSYTHLTLPTIYSV